MRKFKCDGCGKTFVTDSTDEKNWEEYLDNFGPLIVTSDARAEVCDDCYNHMMKIIEQDPSILDEHRKEILDRKKN